MPKCPKNSAWPRQNVTTLNQNVRNLNQNVRLFLGQFVLRSFVFNSLSALFSEIFFIPPIFPALGVKGKAKLETGNSKLKACPVSSFQFPISSSVCPVSSFQFPVSSFQFRISTEPTRLRHSKQKTHLHPVRLAIFVPLSYGLPTKQFYATSDDWQGSQQTRRQGRVMAHEVFDPPTGLGVRYFRGKVAYGQLDRTVQLPSTS